MHGPVIVEKKVSKYQFCFEQFIFCNYLKNICAELNELSMRKISS